MDNSKTAGIPVTALPRPAGRLNGPVVLLGVLACALAFLLQAAPLCRPLILYDDFQMLATSLTWQSTWNNLWLPANEHAMPLGRLSTYLLVQLAGKPTAFAGLIAWQGPLAVVAGMWLVYLFVRREVGHPFYGLLAMAFFGVSSVYNQALWWFSSSFSVLSLDTFLLALLAAQGWRQQGRWIDLALSGLWTALAAGWFAFGILAGPLCFLYLLPFQARGDAALSAQPLGRRWAAALVPLLGSAIFLAISLPRTAQHILHLEHYEGKTALQAFGPLKGLELTGRALVDGLLLGTVGVSGLVTPDLLVAVALAALAAAAAWWWRHAPYRRLLLLGLGSILSSYWLAYSARADWSYKDMMYGWTRYHLFPQLGLSLVLCAGLPRWQGRWFRLDPAGSLSRRQIRSLCLLLGALFLVQFPRALLAAPVRAEPWFHAIESILGLPEGLLATPAYDVEQLAVLRQIEEMDARCRELHIDADTARQALDHLSVPSCDRDNGWDFLRGSHHPQPRTVAEVRALLNSLR